MKSDRMEEVKTSFLNFVETIARLRDPKDGCPWDLEQDHQSLRKYMVEEAYEAAQAMAEGDVAEIVGELGDVLLQVVLNAQVGRDEGQFNIVDVIDGINEKMIRRHPHVFGDLENNISKEQVKENWEVIKSQEKGQKPKGYFSAAMSKFPATTQAEKIGKLSKKIAFDWSSAKGVLDKLNSEVDELNEAFKGPAFQGGDSSDVLDELGDCFFTLAQLCRHLDQDAEMIALRGNRKFLNRFALVEERVLSEGKSLKELNAAELENYWLEAKMREKQK